MSIAPASAGYMGAQQPNSDAAPINAHSFLIDQIIGRLATSALVRVVSVSNSGGISPVGTVSVHPLVNQIDGYGNATPHGVINNLPYIRIQGGADAIILDPKVGDIGLAVFCSRDISAVKATKAEANPGSLRRYDWADGIYIGGVLNGTPTQYIAFAGDSIAITARENVTITAPGKVTITSPIVEASGEIRATGQVTGKYGTGGSVTVTDHTHAGGPPPTPGT